ncbi:MAG TPA: cytochrome c [Micropepsaceae bacterium]|nr:cytochrome c [Micropepsaceae bacterium]
MTAREFGRMAALSALGLAGTVLLAAAAAPNAARPLAPPLTLLEMMRANVEIPADGIWSIEGMDKLSDQEWALAEQDAINLIASATFISTGGTGAKDKEWAANADYQNWAREVQQTGVQIKAAIKAKDMMKLNDAADHLTEICQSCHDKYRPEIPSDGIMRFPFYPARALKTKP